MRDHAATLAATALVAVALSLFPLVGVAGPESALVLGVVLTPFYAAATARAIARNQGVPFIAAVRLAAMRAVLGMLVCQAILFASGLLRGACEPLLGAVWLLVGLGPGLLLATITGAIVGAFAKPARVATAIAAVLPLSEMAIALARFYASPAIFAYGHFFGYFPGTFYDEDVRITPTLLLFRAITIATIAALALLGTATLPAVGDKLSLTRLRTHRGRFALGASLMVAAVATFASSDAAGFSASRASLADRLGRQVRGTRCDVVVPRELPQESARLLALDCDFWIDRHERVLGVAQHDRVTAYFFRSADEKREAMGAAHVYIAKPWRSEVYLQLDEWPHPVLAHELAHIVAGRVATNPFRVSFSGVLPNPGFIEGVAVALAWSESEELDPHEWTRALIDLGKAPRLDDLLGFRFLRGAANRSYTAAGSFFRFVLTEYGPEALRAAYASGDLVSATGVPLAALEARWLTFLAALPDNEHARRLAAVRFERGAIFERACPHLVARLRDELADAIASGDVASAVARCDEIVRIDPSDTRTRFSKLEALLALGDESAVEDYLAALRQAGLPPTLIARAEEIQLNARWARGDIPSGDDLDRLANAARGRDALRTFEVKRLAAAERGATGALLGRILVESRPGPRTASTMAAIDELRSVRSDGLADYLAARQIAREGDAAIALDYTTRALDRGLPLQSLELEAWRMATRFAFLAGSLELALSHAQHFAAIAHTNADRNAAETWLARLRYAERNAHP